MTVELGDWDLVAVAALWLILTATFYGQLNETIKESHYYGKYPRLYEFVANTVHTAFTFFVSVGVVVTILVIF